MHAREQNQGNFFEKLNVLYSTDRPDEVVVQDVLIANQNCLYYYGA
jgi:hypothetical protein